MFRPTLYHPYNHPYKPCGPSSPAGFRFGDFVPRRRCFNLFQGPDFANTRSPDPSPLSSPVRGAPNQDDAPPTSRLAGLFGHVFGSPQNPSAPPPDQPQNANPDAVPAQDPDPLPTSRPRKRKGPKHLSFKKAAREVPPYRNERLKARQAAFRAKYRDDGYNRRMVQARGDITRLRREAEMLMESEHMNAEDRIFLEQLEKLELDQKLEHSLERCRRQMARAAEESEERRREHEARDREAERLWREQVDEEALEEQKRKVEEFVQAEDEKRQAHHRQEKEHNLRAEEEAIRADAEQQRAHQAAERRIREEQERLLREELARKAKQEERRRQEEQERRLREERARQEQEERQRLRQEQERKLREAVERLRQAARERQQREEQERKSREEAHRQRQGAYTRYFREERERRRAKEEQEREARRAAEQDQANQQVCRHFGLYEGKWNELRTSTSLPPIDVREMPWPVFSTISSADQITYQEVRAFLFHPLRPGVEGKTAREKVKSEVLRFHPDKFNTRIVPKIHPSQQAVAQEIAGAVARILTTIMTEEMRQ